jgi:dTDP-4-dehydrorhamnose reductase
MSSEPQPTLHGLRVLVTGASGQLGTYLLPAVRAQGGIAIATGSRAAAGIDVVADLAEPEAAARLIVETRPDVIIHAAACTDVDGVEREAWLGERGNTQATRNLVAATRGTRAYLLAVSTDMVFPGDGGAPYLEDAAPSQISRYGATKLAAEHAVLEGSGTFGIARTAWLYGGTGKHFPRTVLTVLKSRGSIDVVDDEFGSPTFSGDLAASLVAIGSKRASGVFHLVNAGRASRFELARETARLAGFDPELVRPISTKEFLERFPLPARRPKDSTLLNLRAARLGVTLRDWRAALASYVPTLARELDVSNSPS